MTHSSNIIVYPTSADPPTWGHGDILQRAAQQFDSIYWVIGNNSQKNPFFSIKERLSMMEEYVKYYRLKNVILDSHSKSIARYTVNKNARFILRGLRNTTDFYKEFELSVGNRGINKEIETVCLFAKPHYACISSSLVRELMILDEKIDQYVPPQVARMIQKFLEKKKIAAHGC